MCNNIPISVTNLNHTTFFIKTRNVCSRKNFIRSSYVFNIPSRYNGNNLKTRIIALSNENNIPLLYERMKNTS